MHVREDGARFKRIRKIAKEKCVGRLESELARLKGEPNE